MAASSQNRLYLFSLLALVIGSMTGAGFFHLPSTFAVATGPFGAVIAWWIAAGGMCLLTGQTLAERKPDLDGGVPVCARSDLGHRPGTITRRLAAKNLPKI